MIMMQTDLFGWIKRNIKNMNEYEKRKTLSETKQIQILLEKDLNKNMRGVV